MSRPTGGAAPTAEHALLAAQAELAESSQRFQLALAAGHLGDWSWAAANDVVTLGDRAADIFGLPRGQQVTWTAMRDLLHPEDRERARQAVEQSIATRTDYDIQYRVTQPATSQSVWIAARGRGTYGADGAVLGMIGVVQDITRNKNAEEALRQSEQFNRTIIESSRDCIKTLALDGALLWISDTGRHQLCIGDPDEVAGKSYVDFWENEDRVAAQQVVAAATEGVAGSFVGRFPVQGVDRWWDVAVSPILDAAGRPERLLAISRDVTERILAAQALKEESRVLELLNQTGTKVASELDVQAIVQAVTDSATGLSGAQFGAFFYNITDEHGEAYQLFTLSGAPREAFEKFGHPRATPLFGPTFRGEGVIRSDDVSADPRYGQWAPHHGKPKGHLPVRSYLAVPVMSRSGEVLGGLFFGHPEPGVFTARAERLVLGVAAQAAIAIDNARLYEASQKSAERERTARAAVERLNTAKDEFLATLSHELRTPLSAIVGWSQILRRGNTSPDDLARAVEVIERNARAQTQLIEDLLDMSRITSGKVRLDIQTVLPVSFCEAAAQALKPAADLKGVRLEVLLDPVAGPVSGDPGRLQQVVWNLLSNAIKFTPRGGKIQVRLERVNSHVEITVSDTGAGIEPGFLEHVFERFRQADSSTTRKHSGLGLGLSIVRHLVELHGGSVHASSPGVGKGASFRVNLPLTVVHPAEHSGQRLHPKAQGIEPPQDYQPINLAGLRIVVVDDEPDARELIARVLSDCRAQVVTCASAADALKQITEAPPAVLVSDIGMPDVDGYELVRRVRALEAGMGRRIPAIALTAFARSEDRTRALRAGFVVHVSKPVDPAELVATVASVAGRIGA